MLDILEKVACWPMMAEDGTLFVDAGGNKYWYKDSLLHRSGGPAIVMADGTEQWYIDGNYIDT